MFDLSQAQFQNEDNARAFLEAQRWPEGPVCPHCDSKKAWKLDPKHKTKTSVRKGVYKCAECHEQFTVTVGSIFEDSKVPLNKWLMAIHLMCASKKGMSAHQLHRMLGVTYKTAWFMAHRVRYAMSQPSFQGKLNGVVECDETYVGGRRKGQGGQGRPGVESHKSPVFAVLQRGGKVRSFHVERVTAENLQGIIKKNVEKSAHVCTDEFTAYTGLAARFAVHGTVQHKKKEYARGYIHTNSVEGFFGLLKRGINGTYHQVGKNHLHRYLGEFDFRYNTRELKDADRAILAMKQTGGKRLQLRDSKIASGQ